MEGKATRGFHLHVTKDIRNFVCTAPAWKEQQKIEGHQSRFLNDRWLVAWSLQCEGTQYRWTVGNLVNDVITRDVQALVVESDQEVKFERKCRSLI